MHSVRHSYGRTSDGVLFNGSCLVSVPSITLPIRGFAIDLQLKAANPSHDSPLSIFESGTGDFQLKVIPD